MTGIEIASVTIGGLTLLGGIIVYVEKKITTLHQRISDLKDKVHELELEGVKADDNIKKHIHGCINYKLKEGLSNL